MEATGIYPNWPPVLASTGLAGSIVATDPDHIPLRPTLINDARRRYNGGAVDVEGVLQLRVRNAPGYAYLREHRRLRLKESMNHDQTSAPFAKMQCNYYHRMYRDFVPDDLLKSHLQESYRSEIEYADIPYRQGNAIAGASINNGDHVVFFPTGQILQQACAWNSNGARMTNKVETGAVIRQFTVMGKNEVYESHEGTSNIYVAARGAANCTVLAMSGFKMRAKAKLSFPDMLYHVAASPHVEAELAFITEDGRIHWWEPESGIQNITAEATMGMGRLLRCEYSSHPCVLWTASKFAVSTVDLRERPKTQTVQTKLFDLSAVGGEIYDIKRRARSPFQFIVGSSVSVEIIDSRMPKQPVISWMQPHTASSDVQKAFGAVEDIDLSTKNGRNRGGIISLFRRRKTATFYPFEKCGNELKQSTLSLSSLRSLDDETSMQHRTTTQLMASDAPIDLPLTDGGKWTTLIGVCGLPTDGGKAAEIYQLNDLGDLFSHRLRFHKHGKAYESAIQPELPCGVVGRNTSRNSLKRRLPLPSDAILPEHDTSSLNLFDPIPVKIMRRHFPRLPSHSNEELNKQQEPQCDDQMLRDKLLDVCKPSATLFRLHRFVTDELAIPMSSQELLQFIRDQPDFHVHNVYHCYREKTTTILNPSFNDNIHIRASEDSSVLTCKCDPKSSSTSCESLSCIMPHALVITSSSGLRLQDVSGLRKKRRKMTSKYAAIVAEVKRFYGCTPVIILVFTFYFMQKRNWEETMSKKVLEEEEYVEALGKIIERDFFPDLPLLKKQTALLEGKATDAQLTATTFHASTACRASSLSASREAYSSGWDQPTPTRGSIDDDDEEEGVKSSDQTSDDVAEMSLNTFIATHTSEDNEAFKVLQDKAIEDHKQKYQWAYDQDETKGDPKLHLLSDGTWISKERRMIADEACAPKGPKDTRPSAPDTWKFRARNPLLFPPELETNNDICRVEPQQSGQLLLENGRSNNRSGRPPKAKKQTVYANSRFLAVETEIKQDSVASSIEQKEYSLVQMTPLIAPGIDASPLMTWGDIEGTPMILGSQAASERISSGPRFEVKDTSLREKLADRLESETRRRNSSSRRQSAPLGVLTPLRSSSKRTIHELNSEPRMLKNRLSSIRSAGRTPFGTDSELRASYSTPLRPPRHSSGKKRRAG